MLGGAVASWIIFVIGRYVALVTTPFSGVYQPGQESTPEPLQFSGYFVILAIAVFGAGALIAKRQMAPYTTGSTAVGLSRAVHQTASTAIIVAMALAVVAAVTVFFSGFFTGRDTITPLTQLVNLYLPIVLHTALVLTLILSGFVLVSGSPRGTSPGSATELTAAHSERAAEPALQEAAPIAPGAAAAEREADLSETQPATAEPQSAAEVSQSARRDTALAYVIPISASAAALVFGLIMYDLTRTTLETWVWVVIVALIAAGVTVGTFLASRGRRGSSKPPAVTMGAVNLNFILSLVFTIIVSIMSLGYGSSAVNQLASHPNISLNIFTEQGMLPEGPPTSLDSGAITASIWGYDLQRSSTLTLVLEPGGTELASSTVGADRTASLDWAFSDQTFEAGEYTLTARALSPDRSELTASIRFSVDGGGTVYFPSGMDYAASKSTSFLSPITLHWILADALPAFLLLLIVAALIFLTALARHRYELPSDSAAHPTGRHQS